MFRQTKWNHKRELNYLGRNGAGFSAGLDVSRHTGAASSKLVLSPINSKGQLAQCYIELPDDPSVVSQVAQNMVSACDGGSAVVFTPKERSVVLAALRSFQRIWSEGKYVPLAIAEILEEHDGNTVTAADIDRLCEKVNV